MDRVILADDEEPLRSELRTTLTNAGYAVTTVADGARVLDALDSPGADLIVTALHLPGMDGMELLRLLRTRERVPPVIVMSREAMVPNRVLFATARALGASATIQKPFAHERLLGLIRTALGEDVTGSADEGLGMRP